MPGARILIERQMETKRQEILEYKKLHPADSVRELCDVMGLHFTTVYNWKRDYPEFRKAFDEIDAAWEEMKKDALHKKIWKDVEESEDVYFRLKAAEKLFAEKYGKTVTHNHTLQEKFQTGIQVQVVKGNLENIQDIPHEEIKPEEHE
jgi:hypothetical protein